MKKTFNSRMKEALLGKRTIAKSRYVITPKNYKKYGYDYYYKIGKKYNFTIETDSGTEKVYDCYGNYLGEFD